MIDATARHRWSDMFADHERGLYTLPDHVVKHWDAFRRIEARVAELVTAVPDPNRVEQELVDTFVDKAGKGGKDGKASWPTGRGVVEEQAALASRNMEIRAAERAYQIVAGDLNEAIRANADAIVTEHLRAAFEPLLTVFARAAEVLPDGGLAAVMDELASSDDDAVRSAWRDLDRAASVYRRLSAAADRLNRLSPPQHDVQHEYAVMKNVKQVYPQWRPGVPSPWSTEDPRIRLLRMTRMGCELWLPSSRERDEAWWSAYGEQVEQHQRNRAALSAYSAAFGGR